MSSKRAARLRPKNNECWMYPLILFPETRAPLPRGTFSSCLQKHRRRRTTPAHAGNILKNSLKPSFSPIVLPFSIPFLIMSFLHSPSSNLSSHSSGSLHKSPKISLYNPQRPKSPFLKSLTNRCRKISLSCFYFRHALLLE